MNFLKAFLCMFLLTSGLHASTAPVLLGKYGKWQAYTTQEEGKKICYVTSSPLKSEGKYKTRGEIYIMITHRPHMKSFYSISVDMGYPIQPKSTVDVQIDNQKFALDLIQDQTAWSSTADKDKAIAQGIAKAKKRLVIQGKSTKGTVTKDAYAVTGAMMALKAISKACGVKD